jgi:hypothetical protein
MAEANFPTFVPLRERANQSTGNFRPPPNPPRLHSTYGPRPISVILVVEQLRRVGEGYGSLKWLYCNAASSAEPGFEYSLSPNLDKIGKSSKNAKTSFPPNTNKNFSFLWGSKVVYTPGICIM